MPNSTFYNQERTELHIAITASLEELVAGDYELDITHYATQMELSQLVIILRFKLDFRGEPLRHEQRISAIAFRSVPGIKRKIGMDVLDSISNYLTR